MAMTHDEMIAVIQAHKERRRIQFRVNGNEEWKDSFDPVWDFSVMEYRIKPEPKPDIVRYGNTSACIFSCFVYSVKMTDCNLRLTFDGETGKLKSAEVL